MGPDKTIFATLVGNIGDNQMTKTAKTKINDPFTAVRKTLLDTVDAVTEKHEQAAQLAQNEFTKAKDVAADHAGKTQVAVQANVDAAIAAGEIVAAGAEKAGTLVLGEITALADSRVAAVKQVIGAKDITDAIDIQTALFKAEQEKVAAFTKSFTDLVQAVANDAFKPVQSQVAENLKAFNIKAA